MQGATETDFICNQWQSWCITLIKPLFMWKGKHAIKCLSGINQFISWSEISWRVSCQPLNAGSMELCCSLCAVPGSPWAHREKAELMLSNAHRKPFGTTISKCKLFFCQLSYELSSWHQRAWWNLHLLIWLKGKVVSAHKIQSINFVSQQLCKQMGC